MVEVLFIEVTNNLNYIVQYQGTFYIVPESEAICTNKWHTYLVPLSILTQVLKKDT